MDTIICTSEKATLNFGKSLAQTLVNQGKKPICICLYGDLGSGKTVFSKGFAVGLGLTAKQIKSPTFTLMRKYEIAKLVLYHCDFYRIEEADELIASDLEEIFHLKNGIIIIEWPERIQKLLPSQRIDIKFEYKDVGTRILSVSKIPETPEAPKLVILNQ